MSVLVDTNILTRSSEPKHPMHRLAADAVRTLRHQGEQLFLVPQNFYEFWVVATRPAAQNGLGLTPTQANAELLRFSSLFPTLLDAPSIFGIWEQLVVKHGVTGKSGHDARLVAAMMLHGVDRLLTFQ